jgi:hypothetical protein
MTQPIPQNAYLVANGTGTLYPTVIFLRDPTLNDLNGPNGQKYQVTQRWVNSTTNKEWFLLNFITSAGYYQANWVQLAGGIAMTESLTGNTGGAVSPTGNNINVVGDGTTVTVAGNPGTSTLTISAVSSGILESLTGDNGTATPTAGTIDVFGNTSPASTGLTFTGSGHTLALGGDLNVAHGGTGDTSFTNVNSVLFTGTTSTGALQAAATGATNTILSSNGPTVLPTWKTPPMFFVGNFGGAAVASFNIDLTTAIANNYVMYINYAFPTAGTPDLIMTWSNDGGSTFGSMYGSGINYIPYNSNTITNFNDTSSILLMKAIGGGAGAFNGVINLVGVNDGNLCSLNGTVSSGFNGTTGYVQATSIDVTNGINFLKVTTTAGTAVLTCSISVYGFNS